MSFENPPSYFPPLSHDINSFPNIPERTVSRSSTILPTYSSHLLRSVRDRESQNSSVLSVVIDSPTSSTSPVYDVGDIIQGTIVFTPRSQINPTSITLRMMGYESTVRKGFTSNKVISRAFNLHTINVPLYTPDDTSDSEDSEFYPGLTYEFPFVLEVPDLIPPKSKSSCCKAGIATHYRLPPSLGSPPEVGESVYDIKGKKASILYALVAQVNAPKTPSRTSTLVSQYTKYIRLRPTYSALPKDLIVTPQISSSSLSLASSTHSLSSIPSSSNKRPSMRFLATPTLAVGIPRQLLFQLDPSRLSKSATSVSLAVYAHTRYSTGVPLCTCDSSSTANIHTVSQKYISSVKCRQERSGVFRSDPITISDFIPPTFDSCFIQRWYSVRIEGWAEAVVDVVSGALVKSDAPRGMEPGQYQWSETSSDSTSHLKILK